VDEFVGAGLLRWANSGLTIDFAVIELGSNDANGSVALGTYQANMAAIIANVRALGIRDIYVNTVTPRSLTTTPEAIRVSYNSWLKAHPFGVLGCHDAAEAVQDPAAVTALRTDYALSGDTVHWSVDGHQRVGNAVLIPR
jgi:lysophospholipase L1-like esterase